MVLVTREKPVKKVAFATLTVPNRLLERHQRLLEHLLPQLLAALHHLPPMVAHHLLQLMVDPLLPMVALHLLRPLTKEWINILIILLE